MLRSEIFAKCLPQAWNDRPLPGGDFLEYFGGLRRLSPDSLEFRLESDCPPLG